jgi:hypothetical protein
MLEMERAVEGVGGEVVVERCPAMLPAREVIFSLAVGLGAFGAASVVAEYESVTKDAGAGVALGAPGQQR